MHYKDTIEYLKQDMPKAARFYLVPKIINKENNPGRPIEVPQHGHRERMWYMCGPIRR